MDETGRFGFTVLKKKTKKPAPTFKSIVDLVQHYQDPKNKLPGKGNRLLKAVPRPQHFIKREQVQYDREKVCRERRRRRGCRTFSAKATSAASSRGRCVGPSRSR